MLIPDRPGAARRSRGPILAALASAALLIGLFPMAVLAADPVANDDVFTVAVNASTTTLDVLANDSDPDVADVLIVTDVTVPSNGTATIVANTIHYTPDAAFHGNDTFDYTISDLTLGTATATVTVHVNGVPNAVNDSKTVTEGDDATAIPVLSNDTDPDDDVLSITGKTNGAKGIVVITGGGTGLTYDPTSNLNGSDSFTYTISDGNGGSDTATVNMTITAQNEDPDAVDDSVTVDEDDGATPVPVLVNDTDPEDDPLTITAKTNGAKGTVAITGGGSGLTYHPTTDLNGSDTFTYTVSDGNGGTDTATVDVTITPEPDDPVALDDTLSVDIDAPATDVPVLDNDSDPDGDDLSVISTSDPSKGVVVITGGGSGLTYQPNGGAFGDDSFTYTIADGTGRFATGEVAVSIGLHAANDAGLTVPESAGPTPLDVLANDFPQDGSLTIVSKTNGSHGKVAITGGGTGLTFDPDQLYTGNDVFTYTVSDGGGRTDTATVLLKVVKDSVAPVASAPVVSFPKQTVGTKTQKVSVSWSATDAGTGVASYRLQVSANGGKWTTVSLSSGSATSVKRTLSNGDAYRFRVRATDKEANTSSYVYGPTFRSTRYQDNSGAVHYTGTWALHKDKLALGHHKHHTATSTSASASLTTTMTDVAWVATKSHTGGRTEVWIDGVKVATVDLGAKHTHYRKLVFRRHFGVLATHTIELRPAGGGRTDLDTFIVLR